MGRIEREAVQLRPLEGAGDADGKKIDGWVAVVLKKEACLSQNEA